MLGAPVELTAECSASDAEATVDAIVRQVEDGRIRNVFVGERHGVGPVKRFVVDVANALTDRGHDVGLYIEGFDRGCAPGSTTCTGRVAEAFNAEAFATLRAESRAAVRPLDPLEKDRRTARMASMITDRMPFRSAEALSARATSRTRARNSFVSWDPFRPCEPTT